MTLTTLTTAVEYTGTGLVSVYPYPFRILEAANLVVVQTDTVGVETTLVLNVGYTVSGVGNGSGGSITLTTALPLDYGLRIARVIPRTQGVDLVNQGPFFAEVHEEEFDRLTMMAQQALAYGASGHYAADGARITGLSDGTGVQDAVTKGQMDTAIAAVTAGSYNPVLATGTTQARTLEDRFADVPGLDEFGGDPTGSAESSGAVAAAIAAGFRAVRVNGVYKMAPASPIALPFGFTFLGNAGYGLSKLLKATTGGVFTVATAGVKFVMVHFDADVATNPAFGTTGVFVDYIAGATSAEGRMIACDSSNVDRVLRFAPDAGYRHQVIGGYWVAYTLTAGSEGIVYQTGNGGPDTGALFRKLNGFTTDGQIDETGSTDSEHIGVSCRRVITTSTTTLLGVQGGIWGSLGAPVTIDGAGTRIMGIRVAGDITLAATMTGSCTFTADQTSGTFTDNTAFGVCKTLVRPLTAGYMLVNKCKVSLSINAGELNQKGVSSNIGDAGVTVTLDQSKTVLRFGSVVTADRDITLPATARDGYVVEALRQAAATGAFNVNFKTSGGTTLLSLGAAKDGGAVIWDGPTAAWMAYKFWQLP